METHLNNLLKLTASPRHSILNCDIQLALDTLATQKVSFAFKAWQIRQKCLAVLQLALESNNQLMTISALGGIEYVVNHPEFEGFTGEDVLDKMDAKLLVVQVLNSLNYLPKLRDNEKLHGLKILLSLCCKYTTSFSGELIIKVVQVCSLCCQGRSVTRETQASAEALSTQAVARLANADISNDVTNDVIGLIKFFVQQLDLSICNSVRALYLECMLVVLQILDENFVKDSELFLSLVHKNLCQTLVALLDIAVKDNSEVSTGKYQSQEQFNLYKKIFFISTELIRLIGSNETTGPAMDPLFHALFLWPVDHHKITIIKFLAKFLSKPKSLLQFLGFKTLKQDDFRYNLLKQLLDDTFQTMLNCAGSSLHLECDLAAVQLVTAIIKALKHFHNACPLVDIQDEKYVRETFGLANAISDSDISVYMSPLHKSKSVQSIQNYLSMEDIHSPSSCYLSAVDDSDISDGGEYLVECDLSNPTREALINSPTADNLSDDTSICTQDSSSDEGVSDSDGDISKYLLESLHAYNSNNPSFQHINCQQQQLSYALAQHFVQNFTTHLPLILPLKSIKEVDHEFLRLAEEFCQETYKDILLANNNIKYIIHGESIYLLMLSTLLLNLKLLKNQHYEIHNMLVDDSERIMWVKSQQAQGIYLSEDFLGYVFYHVSKLNILQVVGFDCQSLNFDSFATLSCHSNLPVLIEMLLDIDGLGFHSIGSQFKLNSTSKFSIVTGFKNYVSCEDDDECKKYPKMILKTLWNRLLKITNLVIKTGKRTVKKQKLIRLPKVFKSGENKNMDDIETECAESAAHCLLMLLKLCCWFEFYSLSRIVLVEVMKYLNQNMSFSKNFRPFYIEALDTVITYSVEISSHTSECWQYFFFAAEVIPYFYKKLHIEDLPVFSSCDIDKLLCAEKIQENLAMKNDVKTSNLTIEYSKHCISFLYFKLKSIYESLPSFLNCQSMVRFLQGLRRASYLQLFIQTSTSNKNRIKPSSIYKGDYVELEKVLFFQVIKNIAEQCVKDDSQPFLVIFHSWNAVAPHLVEAACHGNLEIAGSSVVFMNDIISYFLKVYDESNFFHICEAFFRPLERAMQLDGCALSIQDHLIGVITDLVAAHPARIKSGWRCLFNALRYAKVEDSSNTSITSPVFDVFKVFTSVCSASVIATALNDSIRCIFKLLIGYGETENPQDTILNEGTKDQFVLYLTKISGLLEKVYTSKALVNFSGCAAINVTPTVTDDSEIIRGLLTQQWSDGKTPETNFEMPEMFKTCDVLYIWFSFLEQTSHAALASPIKYQACITNLLTTFIEDLWFQPGPEFAFHTLFYVCLPLLYTWLQRLLSSIKPSDISSIQDIDKHQLMTYKHLFGSILQIISNMISDFLNENHHEAPSFQPLFYKVQLVWKSSINLCLLCLKSNHPGIAKLGCSCLNHLFSVTKFHLSPDMVEDVCNSIQHAVTYCLNPLYVAMICFPITTDKFDKPLTHIDIEIYFAKPLEQHLIANMNSFVVSFQDDVTTAKKNYVKDCLLFISTNESCDSNITIPLSTLGINMSSLLLLVNCIESILLDNVNSDSDIEENEHNVKNIFCVFTTTQISRLLDCVGGISSAISSFERRLSLKFLLQRLANLQSLATLNRVQMKSFCLYIEILFKVSCKKLHDSPKQAVVLKNNNAVLPFVDAVDYLEYLTEEKGDSFVKIQPGDTDNNRENNVLQTSDFLSILYDAVTMLSQDYKSLYSVAEQVPKLSSVAKINATLKQPSEEIEEEIVNGDDESPPDNVSLCGSDILDVNWKHDYMAYVRKPTNKHATKKSMKHEKRNISCTEINQLQFDEYKRHLITLHKANQLMSNKINKNDLADDICSMEMWNKMIKAVLQMALLLNNDQLKVISPFLYGPLLHICTEIRDDTIKILMEEWFRKIGVLFHLIPPRHIF